MKRGIVVLIALCVVTSVSGQEEKLLTLDECVEIALKQNANLLIDEFTTEIAGKDVNVALSNLLPYVSARMGYTKSVTGPRSITIIDPTTGLEIPVRTESFESDYATAGFSVNQQIFNGTSIFNYVRSRHSKNSADFSLEDTRQFTILLVKERYYNLLKAEKLLEVAEETIRSSEESYKDAETRYNIGTAPKSDVLQAKVQLETDKLNLIEAQNSLAIARSSLNHVLGFNVDQQIRVEDNLEVPEVEVTYEAAMESAFEYHPALKMRTFNLKASHTTIRLAQSSYLPTLSAFYSYSWGHEEFNRLKNMFDEDYNYYLGVTLSIPIFQGFSRFANLSRAKLNYKMNFEAMEQEKRDVALNAKQAYFLMEQAKKRIAVTRNTVEAAEENLRLNREKYSLGAGTMLDLITAQVYYTQAQSDQIQSLYDYKYAVAGLQRAMGRLSK